MAAFNIGCGAASIHKTFNIPVRGKFADLTGEAQAQLESQFENAWLIIIDEISMVGTEQFAKVDQRLIQAKLDQNRALATKHKDPSLLKPSFGGVGVIICGDFGQLVPIMQRSLMDTQLVPFHDTSTEKARLSARGQYIKKGFFATIILTKQHRQTGGEYTKLCLRLRDGTFSTADHLILQSRNYDTLPLADKIHLEDKATRLVTSNKQAGNYNARKLISLAKSDKSKIFRIEAYESGKEGKAVSSSDNFGGLKTTFHLAINSRVMLTSNLWVEAGLINGAQGIVRDKLCPHLSSSTKAPIPDQH